jgi:hypothetical protein
MSSVDDIKHSQPWIECTTDDSKLPLKQDVDIVHHAHGYRLFMQPTEGLSIAVQSTCSLCV